MLCVAGIPLRTYYVSREFMYHAGANKVQRKLKTLKIEVMPGRTSFKPAFSITSCLQLGAYHQIGIEISTNSHEGCNAAAQRWISLNFRSKHLQVSNWCTSVNRQAI